VTDEHLFVGSG